MSSKWSSSLRGALAWRLGAWYAALFLIGAGALTVFAYLLLARALEARDRQVLESLLSRYATQYQRAGLSGLSRLIQRDAGEGRTERMLIRVTNGATDVIYLAEPADWNRSDAQLLDQSARGDAGWVRIPKSRDAVLEVGTVILSNGIAIQVGRTSRARAEVLDYFRARAFEFGAVVALIAITGGVLITYAGLAPLRSLETTVRSIVETGRFDARVDAGSSNDPLDTLGGQINVMLGRIQMLLGSMRGALDNVAHDLRTPLTRFRNVAEGALVSGDPAAMRDGLERALEEADRVNATLNALIDISEAETGTMRLEPEALDLQTVAGEAIALYADEAEEKGIALDVSIPVGISLTADRTRLRQVLANLIENAVKYTDSGGRVEISAESDGRFVRVRVRDTGIGISERDAPFVWDRLYRADASRSVRGLGLGLSLVKAIVEAHGGRVHLTSAVGEGSTFTVELPTAGPGAPNVGRGFSPGDA